MNTLEQIKQYYEQRKIESSSIWALWRQGCITTAERDFILGKMEKVKELI